MNVYSYELTDIVRQDKNSCILANATILRELIRKKERNRLVFKKKEHEVMDIGAMEVAKKYCEDPEQSSAIVCFSNQQAADYNTAIRNIIFPETNHVAVGDKLMVVCNSYYYDKCELLNGDIITVVETSNDIISQSAPIWTEKNGRKVKEIITLDFREISFQVEDGNIYKRYIIDTLLQNKRPSLTIDEMKALYINMVMRMRTEKGLTNPKSEEFTKAMWGDPFYNALHVKYGYAFTCHKSQGGEWNTVYVDFSRRTGLDVDSLRWKYTAITRASKMLWCINLPDVTPITSLKITPINKTAKTNLETDANDTELLFFFQNDENIKYKIDYHPSLESLKMLHSRMISLCDECGIILTNVVEEHYQLVYYMKASGNYAAITFFFNGKGFINYAAPLSDIGEADIKLSQLIEKLT